MTTTVHTIYRTSFSILLLYLGIFFTYTSAHSNESDLGDGNGALVKSTTSISTAIELQPLIPGTQWTYLVDNSFVNIDTVLNGVFNINGSNTIGIQDSENDITYYTNDGNGLRQHRQQDPANDTLTFIPPVPILNAQPQLSETVNSSGTAQFNVSGIIGNLSYNSSAEVQAVEAVTVPFGTYTGVKVVLTINIFGTIQGIPFNETETDTVWFVKDIGYVKNIANADGIIETFELQSINPNPFLIASSILPVSRSGLVGQVLTAFVSVANAASSSAQGCSITPTTGVSAAFSYQAADAMNNLIGSPNIPVDIPAGAVQNFIISFTPNAAFPPTDVFFNYTCDNTNAAMNSVGLNTLLLSADTTPVPDVIGLTTVVDLLSSVGGSSLFAVGSSNVGATGDITVSVDDGGQNLPVVLNVCQTDMIGACTSPIAPTITLNYLTNSTASFAIFVQPTGVIANNPITNRIFIRFIDSGGTVRGATSTAVRTM